MKLLFHNNYYFMRISFKQKKGDKLSPPEDNAAIVQR